MPWRPPKLLSFVSSARGPSSSPLTAVGMPFSNEIVISSGSSGACRTGVVSRKVSIGGSFHGSSRMPPSKLTCMMLRSIENGFSTVERTGIPFSFA